MLALRRSGPSIVGTSPPGQPSDGVREREAVAVRATSERAQDEETRS